MLLTTTCAIANDFSSTGPRDMSITLLEDALPFTSSVSCPARSGTEVTEVCDSESIFGTEPAAVVSTLSWFCFKYVPSKILEVNRWPASTSSFDNLFSVRF